MKVVFLDIDGVVSTRLAAGWVLLANGRVRSPTPGFRHKAAIDHRVIARLNDLTENTGASVVVTSTWRLFRDVPEILRSVGFSGGFHVDWKTDDFGPNRDDEVLRWLDAHPVERFVILDDKPLLSTRLKPSFVKTHWFFGFQECQLTKARELLS